MKLEESQARRIVLAQAIETADTQGALLSDAEREQVDAQAGALAPEGKVEAADLGAVLARRADILLDRVRPQNAALVSLLDKPHLQRWLVWALPLGAMLLGLMIDRLANPRKVDLLSAPFLLLLGWNLVIYLLLFLSIWRRSVAQPGGLFETLRQWTVGLPLWRRGSGAVGAGVSAAFFLRWQQVTAALSAQRLRLALHLVAAAWAVGVALSLMGRGLIVAYGVVWESTWLNASQVHAILQVLFAPLSALLPLEPFTVADITRLQLGVGAGGDVADSQRWALLYAGLLMLVVVLPRLVLAAFAGLQARRLASEVNIDLDEPYFQRIIDNLSPARVRLGVVTHRLADQSALAVVLQQGGMTEGPKTGPQSTVLMTTPRGDSLLWERLSLQGTGGPSDSGHDRMHTPGGSALRRMGLWLGRFSRVPASPAPESIADKVDVVLHVVSQVGDLAAALSPLQAWRRPVVMLVRSGDTTPGQAPDAVSLLDLCRLHQRSHELPMDVLDFDGFARCWVLEPVLFQAIAPRLSRSRTQGFARLTSAWALRNQARFAASVQAMAEALLGAAKEHQDIARLSLLDRASPEKRRQHEAARAAAMQAVLARVGAHNDRLLQNLLALHSLATSAADELVFHAQTPQFDVSGAVSSREAAMAGATSGAAMGASIDLVTGGLTLGAAAALGALAGGSTALMSALWNNRDAPGGRLRIALSDDMLLALVQAGLLRYLAVIHVHRDDQDLRRAALLEEWKTETVVLVEARRKRLLKCLDVNLSGAQAPDGLAGELENIAADILQRLYPGARVFDGDGRQSPPGR